MDVPPTGLLTICGQWRIKLSNWKTKSECDTDEHSWMLNCGSDSVDAAGASETRTIE